MQPHWNAVNCVARGQKCLGQMATEWTKCLLTGLSGTGTKTKTVLATACSFINTENKWPNEQMNVLGVAVCLSLTLYPMCSPVQSQLPWLGPRVPAGMAERNKIPLLLLSHINFAHPCHTVSASGNVLSQLTWLNTGRQANAAGWEPHPLSASNQSSIHTRPCHSTVRSSHVIMSSVVLSPSKQPFKHPW